MRGAALGGPGGPIASEDRSAYMAVGYDVYRGVALSAYLAVGYRHKKSAQIRSDRRPSRLCQVSGILQPARGVCPRGPLSFTILPDLSCAPHTCEPHRRASPLAPHRSKEPQI